MADNTTMVNSTMSGNSTNPSNSTAVTPTFSLNSIPAGIPPIGSLSVLHGPNPLQPNIIAFEAVMLSAMSIAVFIRIYTHLVLKKSFGLDDYLSVVSWGFAVAFSTLMAIATNYGFGKHIWNVSIAETLHMYKLIVATQIMYNPIMLAVKSCLLVGFLRLFKQDRLIKWIIWIALGLCSVFYTITFFAVTFNCDPVAKSWNPLLKGKCRKGLPMATAIFNIVSDFVILLIPVAPILKLSMRTGRKVRVIAIFGLGLFTCIASIMRFVETQLRLTNPDQTYAGVEISYWAVLEVNIGIICACATSFPAFFDASVPKSFGSVVSKLLTTRSNSGSHTELTEIKSSQKRSHNVSNMGRTTYNSKTTHVSGSREKSHSQDGLVSENDSRYHDV